MDTNWFTFSDEVAYLRSPSLSATGMISIYHKRDSYIENLFEGIVLVPRRAVSTELQQPTFSFVPHQYTRRLVKHTQYHFLGQPICRFAQLTCYDKHRYVDAAHKTAAERRDDTGSVEREVHVTLRSDILAAYCEHHRLVPIFVTDSYRFSERELQEFRLPAGRTDTPGPTFCYFEHFGPSNQRHRQRMHSVSLLCGKCLLPNFK